MEPFAGLAVWTKHQSNTIEALRAKTKSCKDTLYMADEDCAIVFVEPRKHTSTEYVLRNLNYFLPTWKIIVVHSKANEQFMRDICAGISGTFEMLPTIHCLRHPTFGVCCPSMFSLPKLTRCS
jgi:hypothetical protein